MCAPHVTVDFSRRRTISVSYPLHDRQRKEIKAHRGPIHSIRSSQRRRLQVIPVTARLPACPIPSLSLLRQTARRKRSQLPGESFTIKHETLEQLGKAPQRRLLFYFPNHYYLGFLKLIQFTAFSYECVTNNT